MKSSIQTVCPQPHVYSRMGRISRRPKVQTTVSSQVMCELKMNWLQKRPNKCGNPQMLLPPWWFPVLATVLGDWVVKYLERRNEGIVITASLSSTNPLTHSTFPDISLWVTFLFHYIKLPGSALLHNGKHSSSTDSKQWNDRNKWVILMF